MYEYWTWLAYLKCHVIRRLTHLVCFITISSVALIFSVLPRLKKGKKRKSCADGVWYLAGCRVMKLIYGRTTVDDADECGVMRGKEEARERGEEEM